MTDLTQIDLPPPVLNYAFPISFKVFPPLLNNLLLQSANHTSPLDQPHPPVWIMRQAGRYLPEFQAIRAKHSFFTVCRTPQLVKIVTLQPIDRYDGLLDASIIFSDILVVPQAMGMEVQMLSGAGPHFPHPLLSPEDAEIRLLSRKTNVFKELSYVFAAITLTRHSLQGRVPLIGFCAGPWTLFGYMVEGGGSKTWEKAKKWLYKFPESAHKILKRIAEISAEYLVGQVRAGAQLLQIFDTNADILSPAQFKLFILPYLTLLPQLVKLQLSALSTPLPCPPMTVFSKGTNSPAQLGALAGSGYDAIGLDWCITLRTARELVGQKITLQGNFDPPILHAGRKAIKSQVWELIWGPDGGYTLAHEARSRGEESGGWIINLGHGITPGVDPDDLKYFLERVRIECMKKNGEEKEEGQEEKGI